MTECFLTCLLREEASCKLHMLQGPCEIRAVSIESNSSAESEKEARLPAKIRAGGRETSRRVPKWRGLSGSGTRGAPATITPGFWERSEVPRFDLLDLEATLGEERRNVPRHMTALEEPVRNRL